MTITVSTVANTQTFGSWLATTNRIANIISQNTVTSDFTSGGSVTTGNSFVNGHFGANFLYVANTLIGGNVSSNGVLRLQANLAIVNGSASNLFVITANSTQSAIDITSNSATIKTTGNVSVTGNTLVVNTANVVFSSSNVQYTNSSLSFSNSEFIGNITFSSNLIFNNSVIIANGSFGTNGTVLYSNGTIMYWDQIPTVIGNTGIIANSSGLFVNTAYIATLASNSATFANSSSTNTFTVGAASYFVSNGNLGIGNSAPAHRLRVNGDISLSGGIHANGSLGTAGQVLHSNGTVAYWDTDDQGVTSVASGGGLTGGPITSTGTISILANNGITANATGLYVTAGTGVTVNATGVHIGQQVTTSSIVQFGSLGIGTAASGVTGEIRATDNITAYYSDERLKTNIETIPDALNKVTQIRGVTFINNSEAAKYGYTKTHTQVGVIAQEVAQVLPEIVVPAPFDIGQHPDGTEYSISGENYKTVQYDKLVPLLIEAIKELKQELDLLKGKGN